MKYSILQDTKKNFCRKQKRRISLCACLIIAMLCLHILFLLGWKPQNHILVLLGSISTDILGGWFLIYYITTTIMVQQRLLRFYSGKAEKLIGQVERISEKKTRYMHLDCREVEIGQRRAFVPEGRIPLRCGQNGVFSIVSGVIVEVSDE